MKDFSQYEKTKSAYLSRLDLNRMPLISWDFFGEFIQKLNKDLFDLSNLKIMSVSHKWESEFDFEKELKNEDVIIVTDPALKIVFASHNMVQMTGYESEEVIGKTPKFFQGELTLPESNIKIRKAIDSRQPFEETIVNYRKSGEPYKCLIKGFPVFNIKGELSHFIAFERVA